MIYRFKVGVEKDNRRNSKRVDMVMRQTDRQTSYYIYIFI